MFFIVHMHFWYYYCWLKTYLQIAAIGVKGSLESHCEQESCQPWQDSILGVEEVDVLLTIMIVHATQMAQMI